MTSHHHETKQSCNSAIKQSMPWSLQYLLMHVHGLSETTTAGQTKICKTFYSLSHHSLYRLSISSRVWFPGNYLSFSPLQRIVKKKLWRSKIEKKNHFMKKNHFLNVGGDFFFVFSVSWFSVDEKRLASCLHFLTPNLQKKAGKPEVEHKTSDINGREKSK